MSRQRNYFLIVTPIPGTYCFLHVRNLQQLLPRVSKGYLCFAVSTEGVVELANVDISDVMGRTSLHLAALGGHAQCLELLIRRSGALNAKDNYGQTPLHSACETGKRNCVRVRMHKVQAITSKLLVNYKASSQNHYSPQKERGKCGSKVDRKFHNFYFQVLLNETEVDPNLTDAHGNAPLHIVCKNGNTKLARMFLDLRVIDIDSKNKDGDTPLHLAAGKNNLIWSFTKKNRLSDLYASSARGLVLKTER